MIDDKRFRSQGAGVPDRGLGVVHLVQAELEEDDVGFAGE